jgi:hypothetical protein
MITQTDKSCRQYWQGQQRLLCTGKPFLFKLHELCIALGTELVVSLSEILLLSMALEINQNLPVVYPQQEFPKEAETAIIPFCDCYSAPLGLLSSVKSKIPLPPES